MRRKAKRSHNYFEATRTPFYGILLTLPVLLTYEFLVILLRYSQGAFTRNAADVWIKVLIERTGVHGAFAFGLLMLAFIGLAFASLVRSKIVVEWRYMITAVAESCFYALLFAVLASRVTEWALARLMLTTEQKVDLVLALGAGVYEEIIFRAFGYGLLPLAAARLFYRRKKSRRDAAWNAHVTVELKIAAALISSLIFSWLHNTAGFSAAAYQSFYRFVMGLLFCILYEFRGLGIAVWTHSLYDVFVIIFGQNG